MFRLLGSMFWLVGSMLYLAGASAVAGHQPERVEAYRPGTPCVYLFDLGAGFARPLPPAAVAAKRGWRVLPEGELTHRFRGDVAMLNDKLTVVLRKQGPGAELYTHQASETNWRAALVPLDPQGRSLRGISTVKILRNDPAAVLLEVAFRTAAGRHPTVRLRLTTGQGILELQPGPSAARLVVWTRPRFLVAADFFADDMVFGPAAFDGPRHGLPVEHLLLHLLGGGDAMVMCVWKTGRQAADALLEGDAPDRELGGCEIRCAEDGPVWVAVIEQPGVWHAASPPREPGTIELDWRPPFAARWRADFVYGHGYARSFRVGSAGRSDQPCWFDGHRALVRTDRLQTTWHPRSLESMVVYPIDRSPATPLTAFCPTDVLRNTLGVGPCQYVLDTEGLRCEADPTPGHVMDLLERQWARRQAGQAAAETGDLLGQMTEHVAVVQKRIEQYADFARRVRAMCAAEAGDGDPPESAESLGFAAYRVEQIALQSARSEDPARRAAELADELRRRIGQPNAVAECAPLAAGLREIGDRQSRALSACRMGVRWLWQKARMRVLHDPSRAALAKRVLAEAAQILAKR